METISEEWLSKDRCPLRFEGKSTEYVEKGLRTKVDCLEAARAGARAEMEKLVGGSDN